MKTKALAVLVAASLASAPAALAVQGTILPNSTVVVDGVASGTVQLGNVNINGLPNYATRAKVKSSGVYYELGPASGSPDGVNTVATNDGRMWSIVASGGGGSPTGISAGTYGDASHVAVCTFNSLGQATACTPTLIQIASGAVAGLAPIATSGSGADLSSGSVSNAILGNMVNGRIKCRSTSGTGAPEDCTPTQVKALLAISAGDVSGLGSMATQDAGAVTITGGSIAVSADPTAPLQVATKAYVDANAGGGASGVTPGAYTSDGAHVVTFTVNSGGRLTVASNATAISIPSTAISDSTATGRSLLTAGSAGAVRSALSLVPGTDVQVYDSDLAAIAALTTAADKCVYFTGAGAAALYTCTAAGRTLMAAVDVASQQAALSLVPGTNVQAYDAELAALAGLTSAADKVGYFTGLGTAATADFTATGRAIVGSTSTSAARTAMGVVIGTDVQAFDADLASIAGQASAADKLLYATGVNTWALTNYGTAARAWDGAADAAAETALLNLFTGTLKGLVPASGGSSSTCLHGDGSWSACAAGGGGGDMLSTNNLTDVASRIAAHDNLIQKGTNIASATTTDLSTATGDYVDVTGTVTITGLGTAPAGTWRTVRFTGSLTLTQNATSLILPGAANITTQAGDVATFRSLGAGNWFCASYQRLATPPPSGTNTGDQTIVLSGVVGGTGTGAITTSWIVTPLLPANNLSDVANAATARSNISAQASDAELTAWAGLTSAADTCGYFTGSGTASTYSCTSAGRALMSYTTSGSGTVIPLATGATVSGLTLNGTTTLGGGLTCGGNNLTNVGDVFYKFVSNGSKSGASPAFADFTTGPDQSWTINGTLTGTPTWTWPSVTAGQVFYARAQICQDSTGNRTIPTWPSSPTLVWVGGTPVLSTTGLACDYFSFRYDGTTLTGFFPSNASYLVASNNLSDVGSASTARTNLGLGTAAVLASSAVAQTANNLSDLANAGTARTNLGLGSVATLSSIANANMSAMAATTVKMNNTGSSATPTDVAVGTAHDALTIRGADIASAATTSIDGQVGHDVNVTGTVTITSFGTCTAGHYRIVHFKGALTLTYNSTSLITLTAKNRITANGDVALYTCDSTNNWREGFYSYAEDDVDEIDNGSLGGANVAVADWTKGSAQKVTVNTTFTGTSTMTAPRKGRARVQLTSCQPVGGGVAFLFPTANVRWANNTIPTWTLTASKCDVTTCTWNGTDYKCAASLNF